MAGRWFPYRANRASERSYSYSADPEAWVRIPFVGAGVRVRYVAYSLYGIFEIHIDGRIAATIDSYNPRAAFLSTEIYGLTEGDHTLEIVNTGRKNPNSTGNMIALDSVEVYRGLPSSATPLQTAPPSPTFTPSPAPAQSIKLVAAPPTIKPTNTPVAPGLVAVSLIIAYDENGNKAADPAEGVRRIWVRLVRVGTNEVVASGYTNSEGFIRLETLTDAQVRLVVPYFSKFWDIPTGRGAEPRFTLVIPPGNQPGLIP